MPPLYRARVAAAGDETDMRRLCRTLLRHCGDWEDAREADALSLDALRQRVAQRAQADGGPDCGFLAEMVSPNPFGEPFPQGSRLTFSLHPCGLWTALFAYDSPAPFQAEDWLTLHDHSRRVPCFALYAGEDFALEKGEGTFTGGAFHEVWDRMGEDWLWLMRSYYAGTPPEELPAALERLGDVLAQEWDQDAPTLLQSCLDHLLDLAGAEASLTADALAQARAAQDFRRLFALQRTAADARLWELPHIARWRSCLRGALEACPQA